MKRTTPAMSNVNGDNAVPRVGFVAATTLLLAVLTAVSFVVLAILLFVFGQLGILIAAVFAPGVARVALGRVWQVAARAVPGFHLYGGVSIIVALAGARLVGQPLFSVDAIEWPAFIAAWALSACAAAVLAGRHSAALSSTAMPSR